MKNINEIIVAKSMLYGGVLLLSLSSLLLFTYMRVPESSEVEDVSAATVAPPSQDPPFGAVYKEIKLKWPDTNKHWRVTNPNAGREEAQAFLPNPVLNFDTLVYQPEPFTLTAEDLNDDVEKVEIILDRWSGHAGTKEEKFRINGNDWYSIPDLNTLPETSKHEYYHHDNPQITVRKSDFNPTGQNTLEGTTSHTAASGWGQFGWTSAMIRIYYKADTKEVVKGTIEVENTFSDNPQIKTNIEPASGLTATKVDYVGYYEGVDVDGDGYSIDWHEAYFSPKQIQTNDSFKITNHIGTSTQGQDFPVAWDTKYVPDQANNGIKIYAKIKSSNGLTYLTPAKTGLTLQRNNSSVKIYYATGIPPKFASRNNNLVDVVRVRIPSGTDLTAATEAVMYWRTWNGKQYQWGYNSHTTNFDAVNHGFHQSYYNVPLNALKAGNAADDGKAWIRGNTPDHAAEVMWPGPNLIVRYGEVADTITPSDILEDTPTATATPSVTPSPTSLNTPTPTPTTDPNVTPSVTPSVTPTSLVSDIPTPTPTNIITGNVCGKADANDDGQFTISDFSLFAMAYGQGKSTCDDSLVDYGECGGRDANRDGFLNIGDFGGQGIGFAQRYYPKESCSL